MECEEILTTQCYSRFRFFKNFLSIYIYSNACNASYSYLHKGHIFLARRSLAWAGQLRGPVERRLNVTCEMKRWRFWGVQKPLFGNDLGVWNLDTLWRYFWVRYSSLKEKLAPKIVKWAWSNKAKVDKTSSRLDNQWLNNNCSRFWRSTTPRHWGQFGGRCHRYSDACGESGQGDWRRNFEDWRMARRIGLGLDSRCLQDFQRKRKKWFQKISNFFSTSRWGSRPHLLVCPGLMGFRRSEVVFRIGSNRRVLSFCLDALSLRVNFDFLPHDSHDSHDPSPYWARFCLLFQPSDMQVQQPSLWHQGRGAPGWAVMFPRVTRAPVTWCHDACHTSFDGVKYVHGLTNWLRDQVMTVSLKLALYPPRYHISWCHHLWGLSKDGCQPCILAWLGLKVWHCWCFEDVSARCWR